MPKRMGLLLTNDKFSRQVIIGDICYLLSMWLGTTLFIIKHFV